MARQRHTNKGLGELMNGAVDEGKIQGVMQAIESWDYAELFRLRELIDEEYSRKAAEARETVIAETQRKFAQLGLSFDEVAAMQNRRKRAPRTPAVAKYRNPDGKEWSGRGKPPKWIVDLELGGGSRSDLLITEDS